MFGKGLGGIEQAFLDYHQLLKNLDIEVISVLNKQSPMAKLNHDYLSINNFFGNYDLLAAFNLRNIIIEKKINVVIAHGNRAINLARIFLPKNVKLVGMAHNYKNAYLKYCDYAISVSKKLREHIFSLKILPKNNIFYLPNMLHNIPEYVTIGQFHDPIVIGSFGRFVAKKGFANLIKAAAILKENDLNFKIFLGGGGEEDRKLKSLVKELSLEDYVIFYGWIKDKTKFFSEIDIFVLPSLHEPFGIVALEVMAASKLLISSDSEGPTEFLKNGENSFIYDKNNPEELAQTISKILLGEIEADRIRSLTHSAHNVVETEFSSKRIARNLADILVECCETKMI